MVKALVTGGTGFVGHHLVRYLLDETDWEVVVLDSLSYAGDPLKVYGSGPGTDRLRVLWHDLRAPLGPDTSAAVGEPDYIFNLASQSHVDRSIEQPGPFIANNVALATNMLEFARECKPRMFVQFSTDEVYGPAADDQAHEEWSTILPSNPYAASKAAQEAIAISYWRTYGVPVVITNTMNVFGERQHPEKFVPLCIKNIREGKAVPIHGERKGNKWTSGSRHWIYARDVAEACWFIADNIEPNAYPDMDRPSRYNIVGAEEVSNLDIAKRVAEVLGLPLYRQWVDYHASRPGHDRRYALDGSKMLAAGWKPTVGLEEGLCRTAAAYEQ